MIHKSLTGAIYVVVLCVTASCAAPTKVIKLDDRTSTVTEAFQSFLVVEVSKNTPRRQAFEDAIVAQLHRRKVSAVPGHLTLDYDEGVQTQAITALANDIQADAILLTQIHSVNTEVAVQPGREDIVATCRGGDLIDYFLYDHEVLKAPDTIKYSHTIVVTTSLYDTATQERLWRIQSTCFDKTSLSEGLTSEAEAIVRQLRIDELI